MAGSIAPAWAQDSTLFSPEPARLWSGPYIGASVGVGFGGSESASQCSGKAPSEGGFSYFDCPSSRAAAERAPSPIAGIHLGYNSQPFLDRHIVLGVEGAFLPSHIKSDRAFAGTDNVHIGSSIDRLGLVLGRAGYAIGPALVYGTAGLAIADLRADTTVTDGVTGTGSALYAAQATRGDTKLGYAAGAGVDYALSDHLSVRLQGLYYDLGTVGVSAPERPTGAFILPPGSAVRSAAIHTNGVLVDLGLNYRLGTIPHLGQTSAFVADEDNGTARPRAWMIESGVRYFYSFGSMHYDLDAPGNAATLNSRLSYKGFAAHAGEAFARIDHQPTNLFVKGFIGAGGVSGGNLRDEDFPPSVRPYSNTISSIRTGDVDYASVDVGYNLIHRPAYRLGAFVGYHYLSQSVDAYGCSQTTANRSICANEPSGVKSLSEDAAWNAFRVGLNGELRLWRFRWDVDAAYLPVVSLDAFDHHWLRPDINALPQWGHGAGYELESIVSFDVTRSLAVGVGARLWSTRVDGATKFPDAAVPSPIRFVNERFGGFAQASYRFAE